MLKIPIARLYLRHLPGGRPPRARVEHGVAEVVPGAADPGCIVFYSVTLSSCHAGNLENRPFARNFHVYADDKGKIFARYCAPKARGKFLDSVTGRNISTEIQKGYAGMRNREGRNVKQPNCLYQVEGPVCAIINVRCR